MRIGCAFVLACVSLGAPSQAAAQPAAPEELDPDAVRRACHAADGSDVVGWMSTGLLLAGGTGFVIYGATYTPPAGQQTPVRIEYSRGMGPGLILGAVGTPFARNMFRLGDTLKVLCATVERNGRAKTDNPYDTYAAHRVLEVIGEPPSLVPVLLVAIANGACAGFSVATFAGDMRGLAGLAGGVSAAAVAAWGVIPPTTEEVAARRYRAGGYSASAATSATVTWRVTPLGAAPGLAIAGTF